MHLLNIFERDDENIDRQIRPMTLARLLSALVIACVISGCMGVAPNDLKPPRNSSTLLLKVPIDYDTESIFGTKVFHITIAAGVYKAEREDSGGVFYRGPSQCLTRDLVESNQTILLDCGVYIPNIASQPGKVYSVIGSARNTNATSTDTTSEVTQNVMAQPTHSNLSPGAAGVAGGLAAGIVAGINEAQKGRYDFLTARIQPPANTIRESFVKFPEEASGALPK